MEAIYFYANSRIGENLPHGSLPPDPTVGIAWHVFFTVANVKVCWKWAETSGLSCLNQNIRTDEAEDNFLEQNVSDDDSQVENLKTKSEK